MKSLPAVAWWCVSVFAVGRHVHHVRWRENQPELCRSSAADPGLGLHLQQEGAFTHRPNKPVYTVNLILRHPRLAVSGGAAAQSGLPNSGVHQRQEQKVSRSFRSVCVPAEQITWFTCSDVSSWQTKQSDVGVSGERSREQPRCRRCRCGEKVIQILISVFNTSCSWSISASHFLCESRCSSQRNMESFDDSLCDWCWCLLITHCLLVLSDAAHSCQRALWVM